MGVIACITRWLFVEQPPQHADVIFITGSPFAQPARRAAALYLQGYAPVVLPSGNRWLFHGAGYAGEPSEWQVMHDDLAAAGVPEGAILREDRARHTVDNARLSARACREHDVAVRTAILCCQAYHARRCLQDYSREFPGACIIICPAVTRNIAVDNWFRSIGGVFKVTTELLKCTRLFYALIRHTGAGT